MPLPWITINSRLLAGVKLINALSQSKLNLLLKHIIASSSNEIFTVEELKKLSESLKLDESNLQLLIQSIAHIFKQSSKVILKPTVLQQQLVEELGFDGAKAEDFVRLWTTETNKQFNLEEAKKLESVSWELNVQSASKFCHEEKVPNARLQLKLNGDEKVTLEMEEDELLYFYNIIEAVQNKLDSLN